jgi:hypothetical protein
MTHIHRLAELKTYKAVGIKVWEVKEPAQLARLFDIQPLLRYRKVVTAKDKAMLSFQKTIKIINIESPDVNKAS